MFLQERMIFMACAKRRLCIHKKETSSTYGHYRAASVLSFTVAKSRLFVRDGICGTGPTYNRSRFHDINIYF